MTVPVLRERILVVDDETSIAEMLERALRANGYDVDVAFDGAEAFEIAQKSRPSLVLLDLMMPRHDGYAFLDRRASDPTLRDTPVVVLTAHGGEAQVHKAITAGADDFLLKPISLLELTTRIRARLRDRNTVADLRGQRRDYELLLDLSAALASHLEVREILYLVASRLAEMIHVDRVSFLIVSRDLEHGYVLAASEDASAHNIRVALENYPEVLAVVRSRRPLVIADVASHPMLTDVKDAIAKTDTRSVILFPLSSGDDVLGVLFLRARRERRELSTREEHVCRIVANATAIALKNAQIVQSVRGETAKINVARIQAEHRIRLLKRYEEFWEHASDGMASIDEGGKLLFVNLAGERLLGRERREIVGKPLSEFIVPADCERIASAARASTSGDSSRPFDVGATLPDGAARIFSVSVSSLLGGEGAAVLAFRDVTEERTLEADLRKTKDFLAGLIRQSVDAIIAADAGGRIVLFNEAAQRLFGRHQDEAFSLLLADLFPPGEVPQLLSLLRSEDFGGRGRLSPVRREVLSRSGARIPVRMSAAILVEGGAEIAMVAILSDLRPQEELAARLSQAQERLEESERHKVAAEVAGAAAHELNQPLTSLLGLAELLQRAMGAENPLAPAAQSLMREAERVAVIVRKLGRVVKYESKPYVGTSQIVDLDRAGRGSGEEA